MNSVKFYNVHMAQDKANGNYPKMIFGKINFPNLNYSTNLFWANEQMSVNNNVEKEHTEKAMWLPL